MSSDSQVAANQFVWMCHLCTSPATRAFPTRFHSQACLQALSNSHHGASHSASVRLSSLQGRPAPPPADLDLGVQDRDLVAQVALAAAVEAHLCLVEEARLGLAVAEVLVAVSQPACYHHDYPQAHEVL